MTIDIRRHRDAFAKRGLSLSQWYVLSIPGQWPVPKGEVAKVAASQSIGDPRGEVDATSCEVAFQQLVTGGWLRVIRKPDLMELRSFVATQDCGKPIYGYPRIGDVDFTKSGAERFRSLSDELYGRHFFSEALVQRPGGRRIVYTVRKNRANEIVAEAKKHPEYVPLSVVSNGRWCIYWWKIFSKGWQIHLIRSRFSA